MLFFSKSPLPRPRTNKSSLFCFAHIAHLDAAGTPNGAQQLKATIEALRKQQTEKRASEDTSSLCNKQPRMDNAVLLALIDEIDALEGPVQPAIAPAPSAQPVRRLEPEMVVSDIPSEFFLGSDDEGGSAAPIPTAVTSPSAASAAPGKSGAALAPLPLYIPLHDQNTFQPAHLAENLAHIQRQISLRTIDGIISSLPADKRVAKSSHVFAGMVQTHKPVFDDLSVTLADGSAAITATIHSNVLQALAPVKIAFGTVLVLRNVLCMALIMPVHM